MLLNKSDFLSLNICFVILDSTASYIQRLALLYLALISCQYKVSGSKQKGLRRLSPALVVLNPKIFFVAARYFGIGVALLLNGLCVGVCVATDLVSENLNTVTIPKFFGFVSGVGVGVGPL